MKLQGKFVFHGQRRDVWNLLIDPEVLRNAVPGVEEWEEVGPHEYRAVLKVGLAAVKGTYEGKVAETDLVEHESFHLILEGSGKLGQIKGTGDARLSTQEDKTLMEYVGEVEVGGALAGVAQRVLPGVAKWFIDQGLKSMARILAERQKAETR
jgi:carbon monoxide dehydrogenase subunit G